MDAKTAIKEIKQGKISPLYVLYGSEKFRMNEFTALLEEQLIAKEDRDFAVIPFDLSETPAAGCGRRSGDCAIYGRT